jgi:hypothetical protein
MPPATDWKEVVPDGETARFERYAEMFGAMQKRHAGTQDAARALHAKGNLGLEAELEVLPDLPEEARVVGLFGKPAKYRALVRYSNGAARRQHDRKPDVRGIAVKVLGVDGKKLIPGMTDATTQDFLAIRTPSVPMANADEFVTLVRAAETPALLPFKVLGKLGLRRGFRILKRALAGFKIPTMPLAATAYYSALPISYGPYAVHYAFMPVDTGAPSAGQEPHFLGAELAARLRVAPVVYDLKIQFYRDPEHTPIEDASVEWDGPWVTIARLTLPIQDPSSSRGVKLAAYVEQLAFDPWHAREDLRPLGNIMRARNHAYRASTMGRKALPEPTSLPVFD